MQDAQLSRTLRSLFVTAYTIPKCKLRLPDIVIDSVIFHEKSMFCAGTDVSGGNPCEVRSSKSDFVLFDVIVTMDVRLQLARSYGFEFTIFVDA